MVDRDVARYASDGVLVLGGARAILLQVAAPVVGAGVAEHSDFAHRPLDRLRNTLTFAYAVVLGTPADAATVAGFVNRAHVPVAGAFDPTQQLWVAATLYDTAARVHELVYGPAPADLADRVYASYAALGTSLQMPASLWPANRAEFAVWWDATVSRLEVTDDARRIAHDLFAPVVAPWWLRAALPLARLLSISLLPAEVRDAYGFPYPPAQQRRARTAWAVVRVLARILPHRLRSWPSRYYLAKLRAMEEAHPAH